MLHNNKKLIVIIPAYNEAAHIAMVIKDVPRSLDKISEVLVLVSDDGSTDDTVKIAKETKADYIISNKHNMGLGKNFQIAIEKALSLGADIIVNIDGDGQFDAQDIKKLILPIVNNEADMVTGSRFSNKKDSKNVPLIKRFGNYAFTKLINLITKQKFTDTQCGFRAYSKRAALKLNLFGRFTYTQETFIDLAEKEIIIKEVPISVKYFDDRKSHISGNLISYGFKSLAIVANTLRDTQPIMFFGFPGTTLLSLGFVGGLYSFIYWLINHQTTPIKTLFIIAVFFMTFGLMLIIFGLLADMIKRVKKNQEEILYKLKKKEFKK
ncbi:glycosyltransferase family 2 protein [Candidatus Parcubacteria bacterium]|nr:glycosyltransferase family 2 protein [Candidatus Parcubacteria bacterium]MBT7228534.1 glycosyltransferase family 2 protein [Candidatus Parcubacteria bacterium]